MGARGRIKDLWREQRLFEQRSIAAVVVVCLLAAVLVARLGWLQVKKHDEYKATAYAPSRCPRRAARSTTARA
jgi:cell division protein FtsI/penicillin-binding protein 2